MPVKLIRWSWFVFVSLHRKPNSRISFLSSSCVTASISYTISCSTCTVTACRSTSRSMYRRYSESPERAHTHTRCWSDLIWSVCSGAGQSQQAAGGCRRSAGCGLLRGHHQESDPRCTRRFQHWPAGGGSGEKKPVELMPSCPFSSPTASLKIKTHDFTWKMHFFLAVKSH